jgi:fatty acid desaturase
MLRHKEDWKSVAYMAVTTGLLAVAWWLPFFNPYVFAGLMIMAVPVGVIAHNHNHVRFWDSKALNVLTDYWITLFYGFPAFAWIPTHNKNHHKHNNREPDHTKTYRVSESNNLLTLISYPAISSYFQQGAIKEYLQLMWDRRPERFWFYVSQYVVITLYVGAALWLNWQKALVYIVVPQQFSLFSILAINYLQHVHADEQSEMDHSRNFVGPVLNWYLFNNGYHTVHHEQPGLHWSELPEAHEEVADEIDDRLNVENFAWYMFRVYVLGPFSDRFASESLRLERMQGER